MSNIQLFQVPAAFQFLNGFARYRSSLQRELTQHLGCRQFAQTLVGNFRIRQIQPTDIRQRQPAYRLIGYGRVAERKIFNSDTRIELYQLAIGYV